jgi:hypothetical protein
VWVLLDMLAEVLVVLLQAVITVQHMVAVRVAVQLVWVEMALSIQVVAVAVYLAQQVLREVVLVVRE